MKDIKCYIDFPSKRSYRKGNKLTAITIGGGIVFDWYDYQFDLYDDGGFYPKGRKIGKHIFRISFGLFNWSASVVFYKELTKLTL